MKRQADTNFPWAVTLTLAVFLIGGSTIAVVPPLLDRTWAQPFENADAALGPTGKLNPYSQLELQGRAVYVREGCWYCHTQQTRAGSADTIRSGWGGVDSPVSTPDEFTYDTPHLFGTKRTGPDLSRVGGKYSAAWHREHLRNPRALVAGSIMPAYPWITSNAAELDALVAYLQTLGRAKHWRPNGDYEK